MRRRALASLMALAILGMAGSAHAAAGNDGVTVKGSGGSTIVGEQDSAMGLTLMPWKDEYATGLDEAPSLYRPPDSTLSDEQLQRQTQTFDNLRSYRRGHSQYNP